MPPGGRHPLQDAWDARWQGLAPMAFFLDEHDRWVRFHSFSGVKRYAETPSDYENILHQHNAVLGELGAHISDLYVITLEIGFTPVPRHRSPVLKDLLPDAECWEMLS